MGPLAVLIALELVFTTGIVGLSSHPQILNQTKHQVSSVLGVRKIAQVDEALLPPPAVDTSSSDTTPPPAQGSAPDTSQPASSAGSAPASDNSSLFEQETNQNPPPPGQDNSFLNPQSSEQSNATPNTAEASTAQTEAVLNPSDLINSPDNINNQSIDEAKKEDSQITQVTDPGDQTKLLINFAINKVKDINNFSKADDFSSTNFAAQRFNDQVDQAISNLDKLSPSQRVYFKKQLVNFCDQADRVLRTVQLSVPEESAQDLEMARGQCQELSL